MKYYTGSPDIKPADKPANIPSLLNDKTREAAAYIADGPLADAVNVSLILSQPLLLTGEPGTGKTKLAYSVGRELGFKVEKFETKSTSIARDLFYTYDTLRRFHDAQLLQKRESKEYISFNALGIAILHAHDGKFRDLLPQEYADSELRRTIVLIDEIDKAPRDFPNDLLNEIEGMYFKIPEIGMVNEKIEARNEFRPIIIITSNSEKSLPDAFLRRCIYYDIPFPDARRINEIVVSHLQASGAKEPPWLDAALELFSKLREPNRGLEKKPATAELLNWIAYLRKADINDDERLRSQTELISSGVSALFKTRTDRERAGLIVEEWAAE